MSRKRSDELICENVCSILSFFLTKNLSNGSIIATCYAVEDVLIKFPESENTDYKITKRQCEKLLIFAVVNQLDMNGMSYAQLQVSAQSGMYLDYDAYKSDFKVSNLQRALLELIDNLDTIKNFYNLFASKINYGMELKKILSPDSNCSEENILLNSSNPLIMPVIQVIRCHYNSIELCRYLFGCLKDNCEYQYPDIYDRKIFKFSTDDILFPRLSPEEIYEYLTNKTLTHP